MKHELAVRILQDRADQEDKRAKAQEAEIEWCQSNIDYDRTHEVSQADIPKYEERKRKAKELLDGHRLVLRELHAAIEALAVDS